MIEVAITVELAEAVGRIVQEHMYLHQHDVCIRIQWRDVDAENTWLVVAERCSGGSDVYVVHDEDGSYAPLTPEQRARWIAGEPIFA